MERPTFISFGDVIRKFKLSESEFRSLLLEENLRGFVSASKWRLLFFRERAAPVDISSMTGDEVAAVNRLKIFKVEITKRKKDGTHHVRIHYADEYTVESRIEAAVGYLALAIRDTRAVAAAGKKNALVSRFYAAGQEQDRQGTFRTVKSDVVKMRVKPIARSFNTSDLWFSNDDLAQLFGVGSAQKKAASDYQSARHSATRANILGAAVAVITKWPEELLKKDFEISAVVKKITLNQEQLFGKAGVPVSDKTIRSHLIPYINKLGK